MRGYLMAACAAAALLAGSGATAQAPGATAAAEPARGLEDIVVTAQRREQGLQNVPIAVSAFSSEALQARQITDTYDLVRNIPNLAGNLNVGVGTSSSYYLRGLGNGESIATFDVPVGTYVDEVYISRQNANNFALFDVERIEVLRGPQGTLFGRNTTGGAINVVLRKPGDRLGGFAEAGYGRFNRLSLRGSVDLPVSPNILTKVSAFRIKDDGYATQVGTGRKFNVQDSWGVRGAVRLLAGDRFIADLVAEYQDDQNTNFLNVLDPVTGNRIVNNRIQQGAFVGLVTGRKAGLPIDNRAKTQAYTANLQLEVGPGTLQSITGWRKTVQEFIVDSGGELPRRSAATGFNPLINIGDHRQFSQELKYQATVFDGRLTYVAGFYYLKEDNTTDWANGATNLVTGVFAIQADRTLLNGTKAYAGYFQSDFKLVDTLTLTTGIRYTDETKTFSINSNPGNRGVIQLSTAGLVAAGLPTELNEKQWTPRFALSWQATPDTLLYASATRGFKSGGWPARALGNNLFIPFRPETIWSFEGGLRTEVLDRRLRLNVTGFYAHTNDIQIPAQIATPTGPVSTTTNPADLRNWGLEIEATAVPTDNLTFDLSMGIQNAKYVNIAPNVVAQQQRCRSGVTVPGLPGCNANFVDRFGNIAEPLRAPDYTINLTASYRLETGLGDITPSATLNYTSEYAIGTAGSPAQIDGSWAPDTLLLNAALRIQPAALPNLSLWVECRNCTDRNYPVSFIPPFQFLDRPGSWNVRARLNF